MTATTLAIIVAPIAIFLIFYGARAFDPRLPMEDRKKLFRWPALGTLLLFASAFYAGLFLEP